MKIGILLVLSAHLHLQGCLYCILVCLLVCLLASLFVASLIVCLFLFARNCFVQLASLALLHASTVCSLASSLLVSPCNRPLAAYLFAYQFACRLFIYLHTCTCKKIAIIVCMIAVSAINLSLPARLFPCMFASFNFACLLIIIVINIG